MSSPTIINISMPSSSSSIISLQQQETEPLIQPANSSIASEGVVCWCCWETTNTSSDPLIRVCRGCRDPDLQFIHQSCINKFLTALPAPTSQQPDLETGEIPLQKFRCTRCNDDYVVVQTPISPFLTMFVLHFSNL
jgi:hypothetical protein